MPLSSATLARFDASPSITNVFALNDLTLLVIREENEQSIVENTCRLSNRQAIVRTGEQVFSERVTFVAHDIKSIIYQLSLMVENAKQVGDNPEFQRDMLLTIGDSIGKMQQMLLQLRKDYVDPSTVINLPALIEEIARPFRDSGSAITIDLGDGPVETTAGRGAMESVFRQLIANAAEAAAPDGKVRIAVAPDGPWAAVTIADTGPGMEPGFLREHLFRPLRSSKSTGYGIGMYQVRELLRRSAGRIRVRSAPGKGTTIEVLLPRTQPAQPDGGA